MAVEVTTPEDYLGTVIGDLNSRRGQVQSMDEQHGNRVVRGSVMFLRTWTRGWRDKAFVVEDVISAGSQDEGID